jgi:hypothetical protein
MYIKENKMPFFSHYLMVFHGTHKDWQQNNIDDCVYSLHLTAGIEFHYSL